MIALSFQFQTVSDLVDFFHELSASPTVMMSLQGLGQKLEQIQQDVKDLKMLDADLKTLLDKIDSTTNSIASNVIVIGTTASTISTEIDALLANHVAGTVLTDAEVAQLQGVSQRLDAAGTAADAQVAALQAIALKGAPVVPPPPPPVVVPPAAV